MHKNGNMGRQRAILQAVEMGRQLVPIVDSRYRETVDIGTY